MNKIERQIGQSDRLFVDVPSYSHLCWNVYRIDLSTDKVESYNVFNNWTIRDGIYRATKKFAAYKHRERMPKNHCWDEVEEKMSPIQWWENQVDKILRWEFWARCQYEMSIQSKFSNDFPKSYLCIDVYSQLKNNWEHFINYLRENMNLIITEFREAYNYAEKNRKEIRKTFKQRHRK